MKKILKYILYIILFISILLLLTGCGNKDTTQKLQSKVNEEIKYLDNNIVSMLNMLNNISYDNYKVSTKNIESNQNSGQSSGSSEKASQNQTDQSSQTSNQSQGQSGGQGSSQNGEGGQQSQQNEGGSSQTQNIMSMNKNGILTNTNKKINWNQLKEIIEQIYSTWNTITIDMNNLNIKKDDILAFSNELNNVTKNIKDEKKKETMNSLLKLYQLLPKYIEDYDNKQTYMTILNTKSQILKSYVLLEDKNWNEISKSLTNAEKVFNGIINDVEINSTNQSGVSQTYVLIKELQRSISAKDSDIFYINYKNLMQEITSLE